MSKNTFITSEEANTSYRYTNWVLAGDSDGQKVTNYQIVSEYIARRIRKTIGNKPILELCCGIGSITIPLSICFSKVIAVDINPNRINATKINIAKYGKHKHVTLIKGNIMSKKLLNEIARKNKICTVHIDPEWTTTGVYGQDHAINISDTNPPTDRLFEILSAHVSRNISIRLPLKTNAYQLQGLAPCEIEKISINNKPKFLLVYYGKLVINRGSKKINFTVK